MNTGRKTNKRGLKAGLGRLFRLFMSEELTNSQTDEELGATVLMCIAVMPFIYFVLVLACAWAGY